jgi:hypothetical protein
MRTARPAGDDGMTMVDIVVSMAIMSVFLAMFTTGIVQVYRGTTKTEAISTAQSQLNQVFFRLDKEIRYVSGISDPDSVGADTYIEYVVSNTGTQICTELRLHLATKQLQRRSWTKGAAPLLPSAWLPIVSDVSASTPFVLNEPTTSLTFQRLRLQLTATAPGGTTSKKIDITFTALNTSLTTDSATTCIEGRVVP